jgi:GntR family transcriptional regulator
MATYQRIAADLRSQIVSGELPPDAQLPTEHELAERYGVARQTARSGISVLIREGLVVARRPRGHFVRRKREVSYFLEPSSFRGPRPERETFAQRTVVGGRAREGSIGVGLVQAGPDVASRLEVEEKATVIARRRVRLLDGQLVNTNDTYYPLDVVAGSPIMLPEDVEADTHQILTELGYPQVRFVDEIFVRMPNPDEIRLFDLDPGTPVAVHYATSYAIGGRPVICAINVLPGDRNCIVSTRDLGPDT